MTEYISDLDNVLSFWVLFTCHWNVKSPWRPFPLLLSLFNIKPLYPLPFKSIVYSFPYWKVQRLTLFICLEWSWSVWKCLFSLCFHYSDSCTIFKTFFDKGTITPPHFSNLRNICSVNSTTKRDQWAWITVIVENSYFLWPLCGILSALKKPFL